MARWIYARWYIAEADAIRAGKVCFEVRFGVRIWGIGTWDEDRSSGDCENWPSSEVASVRQTLICWCIRCRGSRCGR